jgi:RNA polymerase sigma-70 factor (ECF subfamily)
MMKQMEKSDNELVIAYKQGDQSAIETLVARHISSIYNFVTRFVGEEQADDVTQETFVKVWKHIKRYDESRNFKVWLFTIAKRVAIDFTRKKKNTPFSSFENENGEVFEFEDSSPLPQETFGKKETAEAIAILIKELPVDRRAIVVLHDAEMLSFAEIALIMDRPMNTVKSQYRRALSVLRNKIENGGAPKL